MTTEQIIILAFLAAAFLAGWIARAVVGRGRRVEVGSASPLDGEVIVQPGGDAEAGVPSRNDVEASPPAPEAEPARASLAQRFEGAVHQSRDELARAIRAYHAAVVRSLRNGKDNGSGESTLEALAGALVALSRAVDHASRELEAQHPLTAKLHSTGLELRRLADDVMRHSREQELPTGVFDQLEQHLISAASMIFTSDRLEPRAT